MATNRKLIHEHQKMKLHSSGLKERVQDYQTRHTEFLLEMAEYRTHVTNLTMENKILKEENIQMKKIMKKSMKAFYPFIGENNSIAASFLTDNTCTENSKNENDLSLSHNASSALNRFSKNFRMS